ncbi:MAG: hypothetical protein R2716_08895 [Microthrixaceae bacterium]
MEVHDPARLGEYFEGDALAVEAGIELLEQAPTPSRCWRARGTTTASC